MTFIQVILGILGTSFIWFSLIWPERKDFFLPSAIWFFYVGLVLN